MNINQLDFNLIKALDALLTSMSVSVAAQHLNLSQPAMSAALARLRHVTGDPLLVRRGNTMQRTARGDELQPVVAAVLDEITQLFLKSETFTPGTSSRHFRILANDYCAEIVLPHLAADLRQKAPGIVLEILPIDRNYEERFATREADMAVSDSYSLRGYRHSERLFSERYLSVVRSDHPRLNLANVSLDSYTGEEHALISTKGRVPGVVDKALEKMGKSRKVVLTLPYFSAAPAIILRTDLIVTVPAHVAQNYVKHHALRVFTPPVDVMPFDVMFAWSPRSMADPALQWIRGQLLKISQNLADKPPSR